MKKNQDDWRDVSDGTSSLGINIILTIYKFLGYKTALVILFFISFFVWIFSSRVRKVSKLYFQHLEKTAQDRGISLPKHSTFLHIYRFCQNTFDQILSWKDHFKTKDINFVDDCYNKFINISEGSIIIGSHIGNIGLLRGLINKHKKEDTLNIVMWTDNNKKFMNLMKSINPKSNLNIIAANEITPATIFQLEEKMNDGEILVILADRTSGNLGKSCTVKFLGADAQFPQGPWIIANILNVPVYTTYNIWKDGCYNSYLNPWGKIQIKNRKCRDEELSKYIEKYAREMEDYLFTAPNDWFNFYNFWSQTNKEK